MADTNFLRSLVEFNKDGIKEKQMKAIREHKGSEIHAR